MTENIQKEPANDVQQDDMKWTVLESEYLFRRPWLTARRDKVRLPNGNINPEFYVLEYPDWVNVIAITDEGRFIIERQYRHGIGSAGWEIPAGVCEKGETPEQAARRELLEETGYGDGEWTLSLVSAPNASTSNNHCYSFVATGGHRGHQRPPEDPRGSPGADALRPDPSGHHAQPPLEILRRALLEYYGIFLPTGDYDV